ncbi:MAG TPA: DUF6789 family protein [Pyrinomonadaceae bacterium]|jgi:hypothetical protein
MKDETRGEVGDAAERGVSRSRKKKGISVGQGLLYGALAGLAATVPMTAVMGLLHRALPEHERYPLPPREITMEIAEEVGVKEQLDEPGRVGVTLAAHFGYGAAIGALYAPLARRSPLAPALSGAAYGLAVWAGSYLGWLPAMGILRPATQHPPRRNALMITAHLVWGVAAGVMLDELQEREEKTDAA